MEGRRAKLRSHIGEDLSLRGIVSRILQDKANWLAFQNFSEEVMIKKENKEREKEERNRRTQRMHNG